MNFTRKHIPFVVDHQNLKVEVFDWWLALTYLTLNDSLDFLDDVKNHYRNHENNFTGPIFEINGSQVKLGIKIKINIYKELEKYCRKRKLIHKASIFNRRLEEVKKVNEYIKVNSINNYTKKVCEYFENSKNIFWWEDVVSLKKLGIGE